MAIFTWAITNLDRVVSSGFVTNVYYRVDAEDGDETKKVSTHVTGIISYPQEPDTAYVPYEELTHDAIVGWVQNSVDKDSVEATLQEELDAVKTPTQVSGLPWTP